MKSIPGVNQWEENGIPFLRDRISQLRVDNHLSEYALSYAIGRSRGYITSISTGRILPSWSKFFALCDYLSLSPSEFFDPEREEDHVITEIVSELKNLTKEQQTAFLEVIKMAAGKKGE